MERHCNLCNKLAVTTFPEHLCLEHQIVYWQGLLTANKNRPPPEDEDEVSLVSFAQIARFSPR